MLKLLGRDNRLVMLALLMWALGEGLWYNLRQIYLAQLGATPGQIGTVLGLEGVARALLLIPAGFLSDRLGPRRIMLASWLVGIAGIALSALAPTWQWLIPGLMLYNVSGFVTPALSTYALLAIPNQEAIGAEERTLSLVYAAYPVGLIVSPALGGLIADQYSIRVCLYLAIALSAASTIVMLATHHYVSSSRQATVHGQTLATNRPFRMLLIYYISAAAAFVVGFLLVQNFLHEVRGFPLRQIGVLFSILAIGTTLANLVLGRITLRWSFPILLGAIWVATLGVWRAYSPFVAGAAFLLLGAVYATRTLASAGIARVVKPHERGLSFGILETGLSLAVALDGKLAGELYAHNPAWPLLFSLLVIPPMLGLWLVVRKNLGSPNAAPEAIPLT